MNSHPPQRLKKKQKTKWSRKDAMRTSHVQETLEEKPFIHRILKKMYSKWRVQKTVLKSTFLELFTNSSAI